MRFDPILMEITLFLFIFLRLCIFFSEKKIFETFDISMTHLCFYGKHFLDIIFFEISPISRNFDQFLVEIFNFSNI